MVPRWKMSRRYTRRDLPLPYDKSCHRGQVPRDGGVDLRAREGRATLQPPPGRGLRRPQLRKVRKALAGRYYKLLSGQCRDRVSPQSDKENGLERVLVVRQRRAPVTAPPLHPVPGVGPAGEEDVEGDREGV